MKMSYKMISTANHYRHIRPQILRLYATDVSKDVPVDIAAADEIPLFEDPKYTPEDILNIRCKSRLNPQHRNILFNKIPYEVEVDWFHSTVKYKRRMLGRYGLNSLNVTPGICWPSKKEIEDKKEFESVYFPWKLEEAWKTLEANRKAVEAERRARDLEIDKNMKKLSTWKKDWETRILKKETELLKAKERRERMIEEVRQHFGFKIDVKDERFKQLLDQKELEEKKAKKAARKEEKMKRYLSKIEGGAAGKEDPKITKTPKVES